MQTVEIGGRPVGVGHPCFVIAEAGVNHNGSVEKALLLVDAAADAGADAVKFQTFRADRLVSPDAPKAEYQAERTGANATQLDMLRALELDLDAHVAIRRRCDERGIAFLSTPFDEESADFLCDLGVPAFKVGSGDLTNIPLLVHIARRSRPMVISTGMATLAEVEAALDAVATTGNDAVIVLQCVSEYPADPADANLQVMQTYEQAFGVLAGYSDHTLGWEVALAAAALGARVLEKHLTLDRTLPGPDHHASLEPGEFREMVRGIRVVESALGSGHKRPTPGEAANATVGRRSLVAAADLSPGTVLLDEHVKLIRPGTGLPPSIWPYLRGRKIRSHVSAGAAIDLALVE